LRPSKPRHALSDDGPLCANLDDEVEAEYDAEPTRAMGRRRTESSFALMQPSSSPGRARMRLVDSGTVAFPDFGDDQLEEETDADMAALPAETGTPKSVQFVMV
jgi:hypothetical protein